MGASARYGSFELQLVIRFLIFKKQTTKEPAVAEGPSKLLTLKRKVGYDEVNDELEERLAGNRSMRAAAKEVLIGKHCGVPSTGMEVDKEEQW
jgi:hypothetical protein